jgi:hypothetical protein
MDEQRFDTLAKMVSNGRGSRRRVLTALVLAALATGLPHRTEALSRSACRAKGGLPVRRGTAAARERATRSTKLSSPAMKTPTATAR